jgi:hypothetical protein
MPLEKMFAEPIFSSAESVALLCCGNIKHDTRVAFKDTLVNSKLSRCSTYLPYQSYHIHSGNLQTLN